MAATPVFLSGEFHLQRRLVGHSPWGNKKLDTTERLTHTHTPMCLFFLLITYLTLGPIVLAKKAEREKSTLNQGKTAKPK